MIRPAPRPTDYHPSLTPARLKVVADLIREARRKVALRRERPDDSWSQGCRAYRWSSFAITQASKSGDHPWLSVVHPGLQFVFAIGGVPIRFYRGDADSTPSRYQERTYEELRSIQQVLDFPGMNVEGVGIMRMAVETDAEGMASQIHLVRLNGDGEVMNSWPVAEAGDDQSSVTPVRGRPAVRLPDPELRPKRETSGEDEGQEDVGL